VRIDVGVGMHDSNPFAPAPFVDAIWIWESGWPSVAWRGEREVVLEDWTTAVSFGVTGELDFDVISHPEAVSGFWRQALVQAWLSFLKISLLPN